MRRVSVLLVRPVRLQGFLGNPRTAHLEWVNADDNREEGGHYGNFIQSCGLGVEPDVKGLDTPFLVVPVVHLGLPTDRKC